MPDQNALSKRTLEDLILEKRFPTSLRSSVQRWLQWAYADVWQAADWSFKRVSRETLSLTASDTTPSMPAAYGQMIALYDDNGDQLKWLDQEEFEYRWAASTSTGRPYEFMVVNRQITLAPIPDSAYDFTLSYRRRLAHLESDQSTVTAGYMDEDSDYPLWPDHHGVLVPRAQVIGLKSLGDPGWPPLLEEYQALLAAMVADLAREAPTGGQWGADPLW